MLFEGVPRQHVLSVLSNTAENTANKMTKTKSLTHRGNLGDLAPSFMMSRITDVLFHPGDKHSYSCADRSVIFVMLLA